MSNYTTIPIKILYTIFHNKERNLNHTSDYDTCLLLQIETIFFFLHSRLLY